jgi:hypothetical protein
MKKLEQKIAKNKLTFDKLFVSIDSKDISQFQRVKFSSNWGDGWDNGVKIKLRSAKEQ